MKNRWTALVVACAIAAGWVSLHAQTHFASFTGTVTSRDGNPVPNVEVVATNVATQVAYTARSNDEGLYTIYGPADRHLQGPAQAQSFQAFETNPIQLESGQNARVDIPMQLGASESVEVTGVTPDPADAGRRRRRGHLGDDHPGHAAQRAQLLAALAAAAGRHHHRAQQLHRAQELRRRTARS